MPVSLDGKLVVAISSRAVFDFEEENRVFERDDDAAYMALQRERLEQPAPPGVAGALVKKLLAFDAPAVSEAQRRVEVVVVSRSVRPSACTVSATRMVWPSSVTLCMRWMVPSGLVCSVYLWILPSMVVSVAGTPLMSLLP